MLKICNIRQLKEVFLKTRQIVLWGAGKRLADTEMVFEDIIREKEVYIADNDTEKQNNPIDFMGRMCNVLSLEQLKKAVSGSFLILITCDRYEEILEQLSMDAFFKEVDIFCFKHAFLLEKDDIALTKCLPADIRLSREPLIPKVIHYCWFGGTPIPDQYKVWMESWHKFCPEYEIVEWNENNYDIAKNRYMKQAYNSGKWGFVPDYARLDIIYKYGGIYLDTDVEIMQNLDDLLYQKGFCGFQSEEYVNLGLGFGAAKGLPIIKEMLKIYENIEFGDRDKNQNLIPSPYWQTKVLIEHGLCTNGEYQIVDDLTIYPEKMLSAKSVRTKRIVLQPWTKAIHHYDGSWLDKEQKEKKLRIEAEMRQYKEMD